MSPWYYGILTISTCHSHWHEYFGKKKMVIKYRKSCGQGGSRFFMIAFSSRTYPPLFDIKIWHHTKFIMQPAVCYCECGAERAFLQKSDIYYNKAFSLWRQGLKKMFFFQLFPRVSYVCPTFFVFFTPLKSRLNHSMTWEDGNNWVNRWEKSKLWFLYLIPSYSLFHSVHNNIWRDPVVIVSGYPKASSIIGLRENKIKNVPTGDVGRSSSWKCPRLNLLSLLQLNLLLLLSSLLMDRWLLGLLLLFKSHQRHPAERELCLKIHIKCIVWILRERRRGNNAAHGTAHNSVNKLFIFCGTRFLIYTIWRLHLLVLRMVMTAGISHRLNKNK